MLVLSQSDYNELSNGSHAVLKQVAEERRMENVKKDVDRSKEAQERIEQGMQPLPPPMVKELNDEMETTAGTEKKKMKKKKKKKKKKEKKKSASSIAAMEDEDEDNDDYFTDEELIWMVLTSEDDIVLEGVNMI